MQFGFNYHDKDLVSKDSDLKYLLHNMDLKYNYLYRTLQTDWVHGVCYLTPILNYFYRNNYLSEKLLMRSIAAWQKFEILCDFET